MSSFPSRVRFGILGAAHIAPKALVEPARTLCEIRAVAARDGERAAAFARAHGIAESFASYDALLESDAIDAVYIALPAALHEEWSLRAIARGKHVLVEKPASLSKESALRMVRASEKRGVLLAEAHHSDLHPLRAPYVDALGKIGRLVSWRTRFDAPIARGDIRRDVGLGAGVLTDFGCYLVRWLFWSFAGSLTIEGASASAFEPEVDEIFEAELTSEGTKISLRADMRPETPFVAAIEVEGTEGRVLFENPLVTIGSRLVVETSEGTKEIRGEGASTYERQLRAFLDASEGKGEMPVARNEIVRTQSLLDDLYRAAGLENREVLALAVKNSSRGRRVLEAT